MVWECPDLFTLSCKFGQSTIPRVRARFAHGSFTATTTIVRRLRRINLVALARSSDWDNGSVSTAFQRRTHHSNTQNTPCSRFLGMSWLENCY